MTMTRPEMREYLEEIKRGKDEKLHKVQAYLNVPGYWKAHIEPQLKKRSCQGLSTTVLLDISKEFAVRLMDYGKQLGYSMAIGNECLHMSW